MRVAPLSLSLSFFLFYPSFCFVFEKRKKEEDAPSAFHFLHFPLLSLSCGARQPCYNVSIPSPPPPPPPDVYTPSGGCAGGPEKRETWNSMTMHIQTSSSAVIYKKSNVCFAFSDSSFRAPLPLRPAPTRLPSVRGRLDVQDIRHAALQHADSRRLSSR